MCDCKFFVPETRERDGLTTNRCMLNKIGNGEFQCQVKSVLKTLNRPHMINGECLFLNCQEKCPCFER